MVNPTDPGSGGSDGGVYVWRGRASITEDSEREVPAPQLNHIVQRDCTNRSLRCAFAGELPHIQFPCLEYQPVRHDLGAAVICDVYPVAVSVGVSDSDGAHMFPASEFQCGHVVFLEGGGCHRGLFVSFPTPARAKMRSALDLLIWTSRNSRSIAPEVSPSCSWMATTAA